MKKNVLIFSASLFFSFLNLYSSFAQLSGIKNIPGDYASIKAAFAALNSGVTGGVCSGSGGVVFNIAAGYTEATVSTDLVLTITINLPTATHPIIFRKWGTGVDPVINVTGTAATTDCAINLVGTDYITFDGLVINDVSGSPNFVDVGIAFTRASATDGCQHVTIKNCTLNLNKLHTSSGYPRGIWLSNTTSGLVTAATPTSAAGAHSYNKIFNNNISGVNFGCFEQNLNGGSSALSSFYDLNNEIGVDGGNTFTLGGNTGTLYGVYFQAAANIKVANNRIVTVAGGHPGATLIGIRVGTGIDWDFDIYNNYISLVSTSTSLSTIAAVYFGGSTPRTVNMYNNIIENCTTAGAGLSLGGFNIIDCNLVTPITFNCYNNIVRNNHFNAANSAAGGGLLGFYMGNPGAGSTINMYGNEFTGNFSTGNCHGVYLSGVPDNLNYYSNQFYSNSSDGSSVLGYSYLSAILVTTGSSNLNTSIHNNSIHDLTNTGGAVAGILFFGTGQTNAQSNNIYGNQIYSLTSNNNSDGISISAGTAVNTIYNNIVYSIIGNNVSGGISGGTNTYNNTIADIQANNGQYITGISCTGTVYNNSIYLNQTANIAAAFYSTGISVGAVSTDVENNLVVNTSTPGGGASGKTIALSISGGAYAGYANSSNNNSYYAGVPGAKNLIFYGTTTFVANQLLSSFQTTIGAPRDVSSQTFNPTFFSATDLHTNDVTIQNMGKFIAGNTADMDGQTRSNPPDIGADEIYSNKDLGVTALVSPTVGSCISSGASITFQIKNFSGALHNFAVNSATISYTVTGTNTSGQIAAGSFPVSAGTLAADATMNVTVLTGTYNMSSAGTYIFNASISVAGGLDVNASNDALSPAVTRTILSPATAMAGTNVLCSGSSTTLYAFGPGASTTFTWLPAGDLSGMTASGSSVTCTPTANTTYTITATYPDGCIAGTTTLSVGLIPAGGMTGTYTIDNTLNNATNFTSFTNAIATLNCLGVGAGGVTFNVSSGQIFNESNMIITATGTAANPILFKRSAATDPTIVAVAGTSTTLDGVIILQGTDYITFDHIDISDACNSTATAQMEWGYAVLKNSVTDGSQYVTIKNCSVTLNKTNVNSVGIYSNNHLPSNTTQLVITSVGGANSYNQFYSNTITECYTPVYLKGYSTNAYHDTDNKIGSAGGNTLTSFGGALNTVYGIFAFYEDNFLIENNTIANMVSAGWDIYGIYSAFGRSTQLINNNNVSIVSSGNSGSLYGIYMGSGDNASTSGITNNVLHDFSYTGATNGGKFIYMINQTAFSNVLNITGNTLRDVTFTSALSQSFIALWPDGTTNTANINNNNIYNVNLNFTAGGYGGGMLVRSFHDVNITNNTIHDFTFASNTAAQSMDMMKTMNSYASGNENINNNNLHNFTNAYGNINGINSQSSAAIRNFNNNTINNLSTGTTGGDIYGLTVFSTSFTTGLNIFSNSIHDLLTTAANSTFYGIYSFTNPALVNNIEAIYSNTIYNFSSALSTNYYGIYLTANYDTKNVYTNNIYGFASAGGAVTGIYSDNGSTTNIYKNNIYNLSSSAATGTSFGIKTGGGSVTNITNNMVNNLLAPGANTANAVNGLYLNGGTNLNVYYNSVYLSANTTSTGNPFGTSGIYSSTAPVITLKDNLIVNKSVPTGTGLAVAHRRSAAGGTLTAAYNTYFAGTYGYNVGTATPYTTFASYQGFAGEANSNAIDPGFTSLTDLHKPFMTNFAGIASKATPVSVTVDVDNDGRNAIAPDPGYDEFTNPLPVELLTFSGTDEGTTNLLKWTTASEINNDYFTLEKSADPSTAGFKTLGIINGAGNSSVLLNYSFVDPSPFPVTYYRLKQTDFNGAFMYSQIVIITKKGGLDLISVYPNPTEGNFQYTISTSEDTQIDVKILDLLGKAVLQQVPFNINKGVNSFTVDISALAKGYYFLQISTTSGLFTTQKKLMIQ